jgi:hypothetical protein
MQYPFSVGGIRWRCRKRNFVVPQPTVNLREIVHQYTQRPAIGDRVMRLQKHDVMTGAQRDQLCEE